MELKEAITLIKNTDFKEPAKQLFKEEVLKKGDKISQLPIGVKDLVQHTYKERGVENYKKRFGTTLRSEKDAVIYFAEQYCNKKIIKKKITMKKKEVPNHGTTTTKPKSEPKPKPTPTPTPTPKPTKKTSKTAAGLCVTLKNGTTIQNEKAVDTFIEAIKKAGVEKVKDTGIKFCGVKIVDNKLDAKYGKTQRPCGNGLYILTHSSTADKKKILEKISDALKLGWNVEI